MVLRIPIGLGSALNLDSALSTSADLCCFWSPPEEVLSPPALRLRLRRPRRRFVLRSSLNGYARERNSMNPPCEYYFLNEA